ncbi:hypothetical protein Hanom_Chr02g00105401 [Helianthus anomalus]
MLSNNKHGMQTNQTDIAKQHQYRCQYLFLVFSIDVKFCLSITIAIVDTVAEKIDIDQIFAAKHGIKSLVKN